MPGKEFIIDVTEANFEYEVLSYSQNTPVVVDFWAEWCRPCKTLTPILESITNGAQGSFRLARIDVDSNPNLAMQFSVRSIPTVKVFSERRVVAEFVGLQPENRIREFIEKILPPNPASLAVEKGSSMLNQHQWKDAEKIFNDVLNSNPELPSALLGLAKALLGQGNGPDAFNILRNFPASHLYSTADVLIIYPKLLIELEKGILPNVTDTDVAFINNLRLAKRGNYLAAIDGMLEIIRQDKHYRNDIARRLVLALLELLGEEDPQTRYYRAELASILF